jgi:hypothetical protein
VLRDDLVATGVFVGLLLLAGGVPVLLGPVVGVAAHWLTLISCVLVCGPLALLTRTRVKEARAAATP